MADVRNSGNSPLTERMSALWEGAVMARLLICRLRGHRWEALPFHWNRPAMDHYSDGPRWRCERCGATK